MRSSPRVRALTLVGALALLTAATAGAVCQGVEDDCAVCAQLGAAAQYVGVASRNIKFKTGHTPYGYGIRFGVATSGALCTTAAAFQNADVDEGGLQTAIVALRTRSKAISFSHGRGRYAYGENDIGGDIVTGGGRVAGLDDYVDFVLGDIDTTGTHPDLATCRQAIADAEAASAAFAALPPTQTYGKLVVEPGETLTLDATPGTVIQIDSLTLKSTPLGRGYYGAKICDDSLPVAILEAPFNGGPIIVNVNRLSIGDCVQFDVPLDLIVNVPGRGKRIRVGVASGATFGGLNILAPQRRIVITGTGDDTGTLVNQFWASSATVTGFAFVGDLGTGLICP